MLCDFIGCLDCLGLPQTDTTANPSAFKSFVSANLSNIKAFSLISHLLIVD